MKKVKVSIIIPVYNVSKYLNKCLDSVINQSYQDVEIILVDDGSKDDSGKICDDYAKNNHQIIVLHQKNSGVSSARNSGINKASGNYVCFVDSDDFIHPEYIQKLVHNLDNDTLPICQIENFYNNSISFKEDNNETITDLNKDQFIELCPLYLLNTPCCKLYKLDVIRKNKILFDTSLSLGEDLLFNLDYLKNIQRIVVINKKLYYYRKDESNTLSTTYNPKMLDIQFLLFDRYTDFFKSTSMNNHELCIFDSYRFSTLKIIVENEFRNKSISFWKRYFNCRRTLNNVEFKIRINDIHYLEKKLMIFLIRNRLILLYKIVNKIKSMM